MSIVGIVNHWFVGRRKEMSTSERNTIFLFARGRTTLRDAAIKIHREYLTLTSEDYKNTPECLFMSEIDSPNSDSLRRSLYRERLLSVHEKSL
jgi:hypothetical protein